MSEATDVPVNAATFTIVYDRNTGQTQLGGKMLSLDEALLLLEIARREVEYQWRKGRSEADVR